MKKILLSLLLIASTATWILADTPPPGQVTVNQGKPGPSPWPVLVANPSPVPVEVTNQTSSTVNQGLPGSSPWPMEFLTPQTVVCTQSVGANNEVFVSNVSAFPTPIPFPDPLPVSFSTPVPVTGAFPTPIPFPTTQNVFIVGASPVPVTGAFPTPAPTATNYALESGGNLATVANAQGAQGTGYNPPAGGSGILGFLSGIYHSLINTLTVSVSNFPATQPVSGTVTANQGAPAASPWPVSVSNVSAFPTPYANQNVTVTGQPISVTGPFPTPPPTQVVVGNTGSGTSDSGNPVKIGGVYNSTLPTFSTGQRGDIQLSSHGAQIVAGAAAVGTAPADNPIAISGVDNGGLKRYISTDTNGNVNTNRTWNLEEAADSVAAWLFDGLGNAINSVLVNTHRALYAVIGGQDSLNVTGTASALNGTPIADTAISNYHCLADQHALTGTNTITFEQSNDDTTWVAVQCTNQVNATAAPITTINAAGLVYCPINAAHFRTRISAFTSGTATDNALFSPLPCDNLAGKDIPVVTSITNAVNTNPATFNFGAQVGSATRTTSGNSGTVTQSAPNNQAVFEVSVTAASGTSPTLDVVFQESPDGGTTWFDEWHWARITGTGVFETPNIVMNTSKFRFVWTIGGTTPSFTFSIGSNQGNQVGVIMRRFFDRTVNLNSANSTTASFNTGGCRSYTFTVNDSACVTFPSLTLQVSPNNSDFAMTSATLTTTATGTFISPVTTQNGDWVNVIVNTAGTSCTLGYIEMRCTEY